MTIISPIDPLGQQSPYQQKFSDFPPEPWQVRPYSEPIWHPNPYTAQITIGGNNAALEEKIKFLQKENEQLKKFASTFGTSIRYINSISIEEKQKHPWKLFFKTYEHTIEAIEQCVLNFGCEFSTVYAVSECLRSRLHVKEFDNLQETLDILEEAGLVQIIE